eukprot:CAMPEP_0178629382 /NCGR_PEP_ID=MMETSP0698-20121128/9916_1 /TAXON_ID=265572 /ORGANISM="Extubocellulus spinifer, Strain CCMP396" /LENGTH=172 /DNA_ID=CAMNT_0020268677 /DNA_START=167 /DNA_END=685 /DNA_ORIENTATION=+
MPTRKTAAAAAAPRTILQRYTVRLASKSVGKLGLLVQSVADGEDIYEITEQRRARSEAMEKTRLLAEREAREREQQQEKEKEEEEGAEGEGRERKVKAAGQQFLHDSAPVSADGADDIICVLSNDTTCTSEPHNAADAAATAEAVARALMPPGRFPRRLRRRRRPIVHVMMM